MFEIRVLDSLGQADEVDVTIDDLDFPAGQNAETAFFCYTSRPHGMAVAGSVLVAG
jgi:hypothetical protein